MPSKNIYVMNSNTPVLEINSEEIVYDVLNPNIPFDFKNAIRELDYGQSLKTLNRDSVHNMSIFINWLSHRTLLLSRRYAKKLFQAYRLEQRDDHISRAKLSIACKALSILDNFWVKPVDSPIRFEDVNIRNKPLLESVAQISLHGESLSLQGSLDDSPEFMTNGAYAKAWRRYPDGTLWLHKASENNSEARVEASVSTILDYCNVKHCHYELTEDNGLQVCACPAMTDDSISIADGSMYCSYLTRQGLNPDLEMRKLDPDGYYKMLVVDYLIANVDRHSQNWGIYYDPNTMKILSLHPLFDHNNAFDKNALLDENFSSHFLNKSMKENALWAIKHCDFHFTGDITREMFLTDRHYSTFMHRAEQLGIKQINNPDPISWCRQNYSDKFGLTDKALLQNVLRSKVSTILSTAKIKADVSEIVGILPKTIDLQDDIALRDLILRSIR